MRTAKQIGDAWEKKIAKMFGGRIQPGSGNKWYAKLDVKLANFLVSAKATENESFRVDDDMIREMRSLRNRPGGIGADVMTVMMVQTAKHEVVVMELDDFMTIVTELDPAAELDNRPHLKLVHSHEARKPQILRD